MKFKSQYMAFMKLKKKNKKNRGALKLFSRLNSFRPDEENAV